MKSYILNLTTYGMNGEPVSYDYETASELWARCDELNEHLHAHSVELNETENGCLILTASSDEDSPRAWFEGLFLSRELERIADEFCGFELPERYLMGEPDLNELVSAIA